MSVGRAKAPIPLLWVCFALLAALAEVGIFALRKYVLEDWIFVTLQVVWMSPVTYLLILLPPALVLSWVGRRWPDRLSLETAVGVLGFLASVSVLLVFERQLHEISIVMLAAGFATVLARCAGKRPATFLRLGRRAVPAAAGLVVLLAVALNGAIRLEEARALRSLPPATGSSNVLLIILDTVRARNLSLYGYPRPTSPNLDRLARGGVGFDRAIVTAPWSLPSHASLFTGRYPHEISARDWGIPLDDTHPTLAETLGRRGYVSAAFMANTRYPKHEGGLSRGFAVYQDYLDSPEHLLVSAGLARALLSFDSPVRRLLRTDWLPGRRSAEEINADLLTWIDSRPEDRPFFAFANYIDAHQPYDPPEPFAARFAREPRRSLAQRAMGRLLPDTSTLSADERYRRWIQREMDAYDGTIAYLDAQMGALMDALEARGLLENTLVLITADHGEQFDEHGSWGHGGGLELPAVHVPLIILGSGAVPEGIRVETPVSLRDLPATIMDLLGLAETAEFPGQSLARHWKGSGEGSEASEPVLSQLYKTSDTTRDGWKQEMMSLIDGRFQYIRTADGRERLYDHRSDPSETRDLAGDPHSAAQLARFRRTLGSLLPAWPEPRETAQEELAAEP